MKLIFKIMYAAYYITVHSWQVFKFKKLKWRQDIPNKFIGAHRRTAKCAFSQYSNTNILEKKRQRP